MPFPLSRIIDAASDRQLTGGAINLFAYLALRADENAKASLSARTASAELKAGVASIQRALNMLEETGYLIRLVANNTGTVVKILPRPRAEA
jgi:hypothetical protein